MARRAEKRTVATARQLRRGMTDAEAALWRVLRGRRLQGLKFRRQVPIGPYIVDFLCAERRIVVEADGGQHAGSEEYLRRDAFLSAEGYRVLRFWNSEVLANPEGVLQAILAACGDAPAETAAAPPARATALSAGGEPADTLTLAYESRYRRRGRLVTDAGEEILLDLPEAAELRDGDALVLEDGRQVLIRAAPEPLAEVRGDNLARLAWHIGNRHTPCQIEPGRLLIQRDHVLEDMLRGLGAAVAHVEAPFRPEGGAYGHGRTHGHSHSHDPHADPNAHIPHRHGD